MELSDLVTVAQGSCPCGRSHLRLQSITGRREDLIRLPARAGGHMNVHAIHLHALLVRIPAIRQFEVTPQEEGLLIRVATRDGGGSDEGLDESRQLDTG